MAINLAIETDFFIEFLSVYLLLMNIVFYCNISYMFVNYRHK